MSVNDAQRDEKEKKQQQQQTEKTFGVKETLTVKSMIDLFTFKRNDKENRSVD